MPSACLPACLPGCLPFKMGPITGLFRGAGAFFLSRGGEMTPLHRVLLEKYVAALVRSAPMLEFFMEVSWPKALPLCCASTVVLS
eukprot:SAG22_NODE_3391_length_1736_cov_2.588271_3_plen_85_part_00